MSIRALGYLSLLLVVAACSSQPTPAPPASPPPNPAPTLATLTAPTTLAASPIPVTPANGTATEPRFKSPTPPANPGTTVTATGQSQTVSQPAFYWTLKLPQDWVITYDRGFEILANNPNQTAFLHLVSQVWGSEKERPPTAADYVNYWKNTKYGNFFPVYAKGVQVSQAEISPDKFGGPYLKYEFDDSHNGMRYIQVYASGGGPSSVVLTCWAKNDSSDAVRTTLEDILRSLELLQQP